MNRIFEVLIYISFLWIIFIPVSFVKKLKIKILLRYIGIISLILFLFLLYSFDVMFENWPWTIKKKYYSGSYMGFEIGKDKYTIFKQLIQNQHENKVGALVVFGISRKIRKNYYYPNTNDYLNIKQSSKWRTSTKEKESRRIYFFF